ncbi:MAG: hypothetical protein WDO74_14690 [Pseudomonadota bacterium]
MITLCAAFALSCTSLDGFNSKPGEAYCGPIGLALFHEGFVKEDSPSDLVVALTMNTSKLSSVPGLLSSKDPQGICGTADAPQVLFLDAPVRAIPEVDHDVLSALTFGEGHDHDFFAWVDSTCQGTMLAVVSLMKNNYIELRLFKPAPSPPPNATPAQRPGFALFHLDPKPLYVPKEEGGCDFPPPP